MQKEDQGATSSSGKASSCASCESNMEIDEDDDFDDGELEYTDDDGELEYTDFVELGESNLSRFCKKAASAFFRQHGLLLEYTDFTVSGQIGLSKLHKLDSPEPSMVCLYLIGLFTTSTGVPENQLSVSSLPGRTTEARVQEDQRPLNRSTFEAATPRPSLDASMNPLLNNSSPFENHTTSRCLPATLSASYLSQGLSKEFDPLQREYERICGESNQVSKNHEEKVTSLKLECDKEIEEIVSQIRRKYDSMLQEAKASFLQKKKELDNNQRKVVMNIALAEAFRSKCIDHRVATGAQPAVPSRLTQQLLQSQFPAAVGPQIATAPRTHDGNHSTVQTSTMPATLPHRNGLLSSANRMTVRLIPTLCENFNLSVPMTSASGHPFSTTRPLNSTLRSQPLPPLPQQPPQMYLTGSHGGSHLAGTSARPMPSLQTSGWQLDPHQAGGGGATGASARPIPYLLDAWYVTG